MKTKGNHRGTESQRKLRADSSVPLRLCGCISFDGQRAVVSELETNKWPT